jgi:enediyne biosynthesis protein E4
MSYTAKMWRYIIVAAHSPGKCMVCRIFVLLFIAGTFVPDTNAQEQFLPRQFPAETPFHLRAGTGTNGVAVADFNRNGHPDVYFVIPDSYLPQNQLTWNRLFANRGDGTFDDVTGDAGVTGNDSDLKESFLGRKLGASWGDFDNDGYPDLFLTHAGYDQLFRNNGDGTFTDITDSAGVAGPARHTSATALWFDYNNDGLLDLYVTVWWDYSSDRSPRNRMYENLGAGRFRDISAESGLDDEGHSWMAVALDVNGSGHLDLYVANDFGPNKLYINNGDGTFTEMTSEYGLEDEYDGMGVAIGDVNGNGLFDIFITNATEIYPRVQYNPLFVNTGNNLFINRAADSGVAEAGWGWGTEFFDHNNNGKEDLFVVNGYMKIAVEPNRFFRNESARDSIVFVDAGAEYGLDGMEEGRGVVVFDFTDNGFPDILVSNFIAPPVLYENPGVGGNWLKVELEGTVTNRNAFGTVVEIQVDDRSYKKYHHGAQFLAQNILPVHFGLADAEIVDRVIVHWLSGHVDVCEDIAANQRVYIRENYGIVDTDAPVTVKETVRPEDIRLIGNYPNPFNDKTQIRFVLDVPGEVELAVYTILGQKVGTVRKTFTEPGEKTITWGADGGRTAAGSSGVYLYRLSVNGGAAQSGRMILVQ